MAKKVKRTNWVSKFELVGRPKINDYTYKINGKSEKSAWMYNSMSLYVDCGEKYGDILCEMMGGYNIEGNSFIYAHGKDENGKDDFDENARITVAWEDRLNPNILENIGKLCFFTVGIEKDIEGKTYYKDFLSEYDAIAYIKEHLTEDMVLRVKGDIVYSLYNENVIVKKKIRSIVLSKVEDSKDFSATFTQSLLLDKDSANIKDIDKTTGVLPIYARVLDYVKEINGTEIRTFYPMPKVFYYKFQTEDEQLRTTIFNTLFKVRKGITQINFCGELIENGTVTISFDDLPQEIKDLVNIGVYPKEEALAKCTENKSKDKKMYIIKPEIIQEGEEGNKVSRINKIEDVYSEDDLIFDIADTMSDEDIDKMVDDAITSSTDNTMDWLNSIQ